MKTPQYVTVLSYLEENHMDKANKYLRNLFDEKEDVEILTLLMSLERLKINDSIRSLKDLIFKRVTKKKQLKN